MIDRTKWMTREEYVWPENYYRETDGDRRRDILKEQIQKDAPDKESISVPEFASGSTSAAVTGQANQIRLKLWEARYLDEKGRRTGTDNYLKLWNMIAVAAEHRKSLFGKKTVRVFEEQVRQVLQVGLLREYQEQEELWYDEYMNFFDFYINICQTDKSYTNVLFHLAKISEEQLVLKLAEDLWEKTVHLPKELGLSGEFRLLAAAAEDSFLTHFPEEREVHQRVWQKG